MKAYFALSLFGVMLGANGNAQAVNSIASGLPTNSYSQSQTWGGATSESAFNGGGWNSGTFGTHWLQVDLGSQFSIDSTSYVTGWTPGVTYEAIYISNAPIGYLYNSLTPVAIRNEYASYTDAVAVQFSPTNGRYFQIVANGNTSWTALGNVTVSAVPEPAVWHMAILGAASLVLIERRRRKV